MYDSFMPKHSQHMSVALRVIYAETAAAVAAPHAVDAGRARLHFWREAVVDALAGRPPPHPAATILAHAADELDRVSGGRAHFGRHWFTRLLAAREQRLGLPPFASLDALERYAEHTSSSVMYLMLESLPLISATTDHFASHIGKALGITEALMAVPDLAFPRTAAGSGSSKERPGTVMLPLDVMAKAGVKEEDVLHRGGDAEGLRDAVLTVATRAHAHANTVRQHEERGVSFVAWRFIFQMPRRLKLGSGLPRKQSKTAAELPRRPHFAEGQAFTRPRAFWPKQFS